MPPSSSTFEVPVAYRVAKQRLLAHIERHCEQGMRLPPINQLARLIDSGQRNTGLAVRELVEEGILLSKPRLGTYVTGKPESKQQPTPSGALAGIRIATYRNYQDVEAMVEEMEKGFTDLAVEHDATIESRALEYEDEKCLLGDLDGLDAIVLINPHSKDLIHLPDDKIAMEISTSNLSPIAHHVPFDWVTVDQEQGASLAGRLLAEAGLSADDVCCIGMWDEDLHTTYDQISTTRLWGIERELRGRVPEAHQLKVKSYGEHPGAAIVKQYLELAPRPKAIFAVTDELAVGFVKGASAHGLKPGRDYQIVGFDGQQRGRELPFGPLTTVKVPALDMGRRAAELLVDRVADRDRPSRKLQLGCELVRGTTVRVAKD